ncbi:SMI1/KNR4 family protein [Roseateles chitinivorans]|uniref:SMI1/KNR4 family protein n=1 Tax=Roseateles chitinivorans TaxID=2917965 RepID=UPI003D66E749
MNIRTLSVKIMEARQQRLFRKAPVFRRYSAVSSEDLMALQQTVGSDLPAQLLEWLGHVGYGDLGDELSFREGWFTRISTGELTGAVIFAQDILGSFYAVDAMGRVYYFPRFESTFAFVADHFQSFMEELVRRDYKLIAWMDTLKTAPYAW